MSASLVGSEMCIRDRLEPGPKISGFEASRKVLAAAAKTDGGDDEDVDDDDDVDEPVGAGCGV
eukprot:10968234-Alexandrium_andersonii.AAC.1